MEIKRYLPHTIYYRMKAEEDIKQVAKNFNVSPNSINYFAQTLEEGDFVKIQNAIEDVHIVKPLETLSQIAKMHNLTEDQIIKANNLKSKVLFIGQRLRL